MAAEDRIEGRVVAALGNREVLIDRGTEDGVEIGMRFVILDEGEPVDIPGAAPIVLKMPKTVVKIVRFEGNSASVGRTFRTIKGRSVIASAAMAFGSDHPETFSYEDPLQVTEKRDKVVRPGDLVRQTIGDEYLDD